MVGVHAEQDHWPLVRELTERKGPGSHSLLQQWPLLPWHKDLYRNSHQLLRAQSWGLSVWHLCLKGHQNPGYIKAECLLQPRSLFQDPWLIVWDPPVRVTEVNLPHSVTWCQWLYLKIIRIYMEMGVFLKCWTPQPSQDDLRVTAHPRDTDRFQL